MAQLHRLAKTLAPVTHWCVYALCLGHRCFIVTVGHMVMAHGCTVGDGSLIGIGSVLLNNCRIGKHCIIGANSLVPEGKDIPDYSLVMGSPGKVVRTLEPGTEQALLESAQHYVENSRRFKSQLKKETD